MRKIQTLGFALVAVFAFSAIIAASALAEFLPAEWLVGGAVIAVALPSVTSGKILLEDSKLGIAVVCEGLLDGTIGPGKADKITAVLNAAGTLIGNELTGTALLCEAQKGCAASATDIEVWPLKLSEATPWTTEIELEEPSGKFFDLITGAGYEVQCLVVGIVTSEQCTAVAGTASEVVNVAGGVEAVGLASPNGNCTVGGNGVGVIQFIAGNLVTSTEGTVSVSE